MLSDHLAKVLVFGFGFRALTPLWIKDKVNMATEKYFDTLQELQLRTRKKRTDVGKYSFVNRTITNWNQLSASLLASFPCKLSTFRKRVKGIQVRGECK